VLVECPDNCKFDAFEILKAKNSNFTRYEMNEDDNICLGAAK